MTIVVRNLREFVRATDRAGPSTKKMVRNELRLAGDLVRADAYARFRPFSERTARGFRVAVRQRGVSVEQRLARTTGLHPEWGVEQMEKALLPARAAELAVIARSFEKSLLRICDEIKRS